MSSSRNADAAVVTPFPPGISSARATGATGEGSDLSRQNKSRKGGKPRPRPDRSSRPDEERFNVGPISPRNTSAARNNSRRATRSGRHDRPVLADLNDAVPNYPPPSFQEAISSPAVSVCPSTLTLVSTMVSPVATFIPSSMPSIPHESATPSPSIPPDVNSTDPESTSDSDYSLEIIDRGSVPPDHGLPTGSDLDTRVREDYRHRRGVEFPSPASRMPDQAPTKSSSGIEARGRTQRPTLDVAILEGQDTPRSPTISSPKRRFLSLSPLRTIFPSKTPQSGDRPQTAHPTPGTSPYMQSPKGSTFFRSTTSLATASFLRLPLSSVSNNGKPEKRRLFGSKKEKPKEVPSNEALDSWEELSVDEASETPSSLLSVVEAACKCTSPTASASPTRSVSFTYGGPATETYRPLHASIASSVATAPPAPTTPTPTSPPPAQKENLANSVHPLSLRDRKTPLPFVQRPVRRSPAPTPPRIQVPIPVPQDPVVTTVRTRLAPNSSAHPSAAIPRNSVTAHVARPSPLSLDAFQPEASDEPQRSDPSFWKAVETPLPSSPIKVALPLSPTPPSPSQLPLRAAVQAPAVPASPVRASTPARPEKTPESGVSKARWPSPPLVEQPAVFSRAPSPFVDEPVTPTRHHYPGRPLPRPPGHPRNHIDSTFAPNEEFSETPSSAGLTTCPEGLLIDLDDGSSCRSVQVEAISRSEPTTELLVDLSDLAEDEEGTILAPIPQFAAIGTSSFMPPLSSTPIPTSITHRDPHTTEPDAHPVYSNITDLDLLASQLADDEERLRNGNSYDVSCSPAPSLLDAGREQEHGVAGEEPFVVPSSSLKPAPLDEGLPHGSRVHRFSEPPSRVQYQQHHLPSRISWRTPGSYDVTQGSQFAFGKYNGSVVSFSNEGDTSTSEFSDDNTPSTIEELPTPRPIVLDSTRPFQHHRQWQWQHLPARVY